MLERIHIERTRDGNFYFCRVAIDGVPADSFWVDAPTFIEAERSGKLDALLENHGRGMIELFSKAS